MVLQNSVNPYETVKLEVLNELFESWYSRLTPSYEQYLHKIGCGTEGNLDDANSFFNIWVLVLFDQHKRASHAISSLDSGIRAEITESLSDESYNIYFDDDKVNDSPLGTSQTEFLNLLTR